jgi:hypothetical protein
MTALLDNRPSSFLIFAVGTVGALAPEIIRLYGLRHKPPKKGFSSFYYIVSLVYALLGGLVAVILPAVTLYGAFYAGATVPVTISAIARKKRTWMTTANSASGHHGMTTANTAHLRVSSERPWSELIRTHANGLFAQSRDDI